MDFTIADMNRRAEQMMTKRRDELVNFLKAFVLAWDHFRREPEHLGHLFLKEAKLDAGLDVLDSAASIEPNRSADDFSKIRLRFVDDDLATIDQAQSFLSERGIVPETFDVRRFIDSSFLEAALADPGLVELAKTVR